MAFDLGTPVDERYPNDMALAAISLIQGQRPDWVPRNAAPEVVLIEAMSLACADVANAANATVGAYVEALLSDFFQVPRRPGSPSVGELTLTFDDTVTTTIPAGTGFRLVEYGIEVQATADVTVTAATTAVVEVATVESTSLVNGVTVGASVDVLDVIPNIVAVAVSGTFGNGADPEDDVEYLARAQVRLTRVTNSLVVPEHFSAYCLEDGRASNALTLPAWDGTGAVVDTDAGYVSVVTYGFGAQLSSGVRSELAAAMQSITAAGVTVVVVEADVTSVDVTATVVAAPGYESSEVEAAVVAAVQEFLAPETWAIGTDVAPGQVTDKITTLPQVDFVTTLDEPAADVVIPANGVAAAGTITITVT